MPLIECIQIDRSIRGSKLFLLAKFLSLGELAGIRGELARDSLCTNIVVILFELKHNNFSYYSSKSNLVHTILGHPV